jgi:hypothetical protein
MMVGMHRFNPSTDIYLPSVNTRRHILVSQTYDFQDRQS